LDGEPVAEIFSDLSARRGTVGVDLTKARRLPENAGVAFMGDSKGGPFDISGDLAREWLTAPINPNGRSNSDVLKRWAHGSDVNHRLGDNWIIEFGWKLDEEQVAFFEKPFEFALKEIKPLRSNNRRASYKLFWWRHVEPRQGMWRALQGRRRYIATTRHSKDRVFVWLPIEIVPDSALIVVARDDDMTFGLLSSRSHELWSLRLCSWLGVGNDPRYTPSTTFETFPFPEGLTPDIPAGSYADDPRAQRIAAAARWLNELRGNWLNPPGLVVRVPEVVLGYPDRILPTDEEAAKELKKRTLTNLYNQRPAWLDNVHGELDAAVAAAYGWPADLSNDEILARLFELNQARAGGSSAAAA
jgi:type II restriction/modification system DNA methylase subunit YeeA